MLLATDWTYDLFIEDANKYKATPRKGVYCSKNASEREQFMTWFKNCVRDFKNEWEKEGKRLYDDYEGWIGDAFIRKLVNINFSDYYKIAYGQRPHLSAWFYIHPIGLPTIEDTGRLFCATPIEDAIERAKRNRKVI